MMPFSGAEPRHRPVIYIDYINRDTVREEISLKVSILPVS